MQVGVRASDLKDCVDCLQGPGNLHHPRSRRVRYRRRQAADVSAGHAMHVRELVGDALVAVDAGLLAGGEEAAVRRGGAGVLLGEVRTREVLVASSAVLKPPQNMMPAMKPPAVRKPRLKVVLGRRSTNQMSRARPQPQPQPQHRKRPIMARSPRPDPSRSGSSL